MNRFLPYLLVGLVVLITVGGVLRLAGDEDRVGPGPMSTPLIEVDAAVPVVETELDEQLAAWLADAPPEASGVRPPDVGVLGAAAATYRALADGDAAGARETAAEFGYQIEAVENGTAVIAADPRSTPYGVYVRAHDGRPMVIEVPHPVSERITVGAGARLAATVQARDLIVAGAHRRAGDETDAAHDAGSVFDTWHRQTLPDSDVVVQLHGFDPANHPGITADVVLSSGAPGRNARIEGVAAALRASGFEVCVYDGSDCSSLAGTTNLQGRSARDAGVDFVHVELALPLRLDAARLTRFIGALAGGLL